MYFPTFLSINIFVGRSDGQAWSRHLGCGYDMEDDRQGAQWVEESWSVAGNYYQVVVGR
jgi:hypothetical protein